MLDTDREIQRRTAGVIAVLSEDIDAISVAVEDGVAYVEGVVPDEEQRQAIVRALGKIEGLERAIICLAIERVLPVKRPRLVETDVSAPVLMHYHSLS